MSMVLCMDLFFSYVILCYRLHFSPNTFLLSTIKKNIFRMLGLGLPGSFHFMNTV